jgi:hypothetical protein
MTATLKTSFTLAQLALAPHSYSTDYKLRGWGESCTFELFGWINHNDIPPVNGRVLKALRYLGFDIAI